MGVLITGDSIFKSRRVHFNMIRTLSEVAQPHSHEFFEIFIVITGKMRHEINGDCIVMDKNSAAFIRPEDVHGFSPVEDNDCSFLNIAFTEEILGEVCGFLGNGISPSHYRLLPSCITAKMPDYLADYALETYRELCLLPPDSGLSDTKGKLLAAQLIESCFLPEKAQEKAPEWLCRLEEKMRQPKVFSGGLERLSEMCGKSPEYICRSFKKYRGISPYEFMSELRTVYAANLLITTDMPIIDISFECGYESLSHFYRKFRQVYGTTPADCRKKYRIHNNM